MINEDLIKAYKATVYFVSTPDKKITIRIGEKHSDLDRLIKSHNAREWAFITASNPGSIQTSPGKNLEAGEKLKKYLEKKGFIFIEGEGVGDVKTWPPEKSFLVPGISQDEAKATGIKFGQNAIVFGKLGEIAELVVLV